MVFGSVLIDNGKRLIHVSQPTAIRTATKQFQPLKIREAESFYVEIVWCPEGDLNPHDLAICGF